MILWAYDLKTKKRTSEMVMDSKPVEERFLEESGGIFKVRSILHQFKDQLEKQGKLRWV